MDNVNKGYLKLCHLEKIDDLFDLMTDQPLDLAPFKVKYCEVTMYLIQTSYIYFKLMSVLEVHQQLRLS